MKIFLRKRKYAKYRIVAHFDEQSEATLRQLQPINQYTNKPHLHTPLFTQIAKVETDNVDKLHDVKNIFEQYNETPQARIVDLFEKNEMFGRSVCVRIDSPYLKLLQDVIYDKTKKSHLNYYDYTSPLFVSLGQKGQGLCERYYMSDKINGFPLYIKKIIMVRHDDDAVIFSFDFRTSQCSSWSPEQIQSSVSYKKPKHKKPILEKLVLIAHLCSPLRLLFG